MTPVMTRVSSHAMATMTAVWVTPMTAISAKNPRDAPA
jgi:hypothetical protein